MTQKLLLTGGTGLVGKALTQALTREGVRVVSLVRRPSQQRPETGVREVVWHPDRALAAAELAELEGCDAAVHLAGANVSAKRWTPSYKRLILSSRVETAHGLGRIFTELTSPPRVVVSASATGYYGDRAGEVLTESSSAGNGFLAGVCKSWEAATAPLAPRVAHMRFGIILTSRGGALPRLLRMFRLGLGGKLGTGRQWMSWVSLDDAVGAIRFALAESALSGPCNTVSPFPVTNAEFTRTLGRILHRPTLMQVPAVALRAVFGEMGEDALLASTRAVPERLHAAGFQFSHERLEQTVAEMV